MRHNLRTVAMVAVVGVASAIGFGRLLKSMLYSLAPTDPVALSLAILILTTAAAVAAWAPARRAANIDPAITLRQD